VLDGLLEHDTELDPRTCYTDTHGYTEIVMATAALLGFELAPRIRDMRDQTLYKLDHSQHYPDLDPILTGAIKVHRITPAWDEVVRLVASMSARVVSPSLALLRLGWRHLNAFGRYYFDLVRMRQDGGQLVELPSEPSASERVGP
jgi:TnpA family transposase